MTKAVPLFIVISLVAIGIWFFLVRPDDVERTIAEPETTAALPLGPKLSSLASTPNWSKLEAFQNHVTREEFEHDLTEIFGLPQSWENSLAIENDAVWVKHHQGPDSGESKIAFATSELTPTPLPPLSEMHIAIDPGHIGGDFAHLEQRNFQPFPDDDGQVPIREGDLTLATAHLLKPLLEELGAQVSLVRDQPEPVTTQRTADFLPHFPDRLMAEKIFYRTAEIRARAELVNQQLQPDLVLCLHYNADAWNDPADPWAARNHFHILLNGAYLPGEVALDDQRFEMLRHLFTRSTSRALPLAQTISDVFLRETNLVPYHYSPTASATQLDSARPIYARNLLANRLYQAPTIYLEPYVMNHRDTYDRVQMGDYEGVRDFRGQPVRSLVREYAETIQQAFREHFPSPTS